MIIRGFRLEQLIIFFKGSLLLSPGKHRVIVMKAGYETEILAEVEVKPDGWTEIDITLRPLE